MDTAAIDKQIRRILTGPEVDLSTISSKRVRKELSETFGSQLIKQNKEAIDGLIITAFNDIAVSAGAASVPEEETKPANQVATNATTAAHASSSSKSNGRHSSHKAEPEPSEDEDAAGSSSGSSDGGYQRQAKPPHPKHSSKYDNNVKVSPAKRRVTDSSSAAMPESSPSVPLSMATGLTDEEYARQLQEEFNSAARGRPTRGGASDGKKSKSSSSFGSSKKKSGAGTTLGSSKGKKIRTKAYIDDSDLEEEDRASDDSTDGARSAKKAKKQKRATGTSGGGGSGSGGGYNKELGLSEPLQRVCGATTMSRPKIVKALWVYIREHNLQDPNKKSDIINDDLFKEIFGVEKMTMFSMNKYLTKSVYPIDGA